MTVLEENSSLQAVRSTQLHFNEASSSEVQTSNSLNFYILHDLSLKLTLVLVPETTVNAAASTDISLAVCQDSCSNISIPYPFGIGTGCFCAGFEIQCKEVDQKLKAFYGGNTSSLAVIDISLLEGQARVLNQLSYDYYNKSGRMDYSSTYMDLRGSLFTTPPP
ncbi:uncharacterized protein A4U43_C01F8140 [Asparagus officinalis]|uniref:Wall-associated receptor kinase galacturonan-binding domain-containing protein n=1 Tax=Asparagus officinalis TaxID=4686 RepID=A0A5P1FNC5_ASPOF|nr:uncharacterized protein A4U43_C01F8140 [Asparagus officinalis]